MPIVQRRSIGWAALIAVSLNLAAAAPVSAQDAPVLGLSSRSFNPGFSNMWIGGPLGLFGDLVPGVSGTSGSSENLQLMLAGQVAMSTGTQDIILNSAAEGRPLPAVIPCVYLRGLLHRISVMPDNQIDNYADLKGKAIGVPTLAYGGIGYLKFALRHAGLDYNDVRVLAVGDAQQAAVALTSGRVDALLNADVDVVRLKSLGVNVDVLQTPESMKNASAAYVFAFARPWFEENKELAAEVLKGLIRSIIVMTENPEAAVKVSYHMYPQSVPSGISPEQAIENAVRIIKTRAPLIQRDAAENDRWCSFSDENWDAFVEIIGLKGKVDAKEYYTAELIDEINSIDEDGLREWARNLEVPTSDAEISSWLESLNPPL